MVEEIKQPEEDKTSKSGYKARCRPYGHEPRKLIFTL